MWNGENPVALEGRELRACSIQGRLCDCLVGSCSQSVHSFISISGLMRYVWSSDLWWNLEERLSWIPRRLQNSLQKRVTSRGPQSEKTGIQWILNTSQAMISPSSFEVGSLTRGTKWVILEKWSTIMRIKLLEKGRDIEAILGTPLGIPVVGVFLLFSLLAQAERLPAVQNGTG